MIVIELHIRARKVAYATSVCLLACVVAGTARAQQADLNAVAAKVAQELEAKKVKRVAVFDFVGPGHDLTALGQKLADDFSAALAKSGRKLSVQDRSWLAGTMKKFDYHLSDLQDPNFGDALLAYLAENAGVLGAITRQGDEFTVSVRGTRTGKNGANFIEVEHFSLPASEDMAKLAGTYLERAEPVRPPAADKTVPNAGTNGYSFPVCVSCPQAGYSDAALKAHIQGTVSLIGVVSAEGKLTDVRVVKHLPAGLSARAVEAVGDWKLEPARGPDGSPVAVRQIIEVTFHLY